MTLSIPTLQFADFVVFLTCGLVFLCGWLILPSRRSFLYFGASYVFCAVVTIAAANFGQYLSLLSVLGWSIAGLLFWSGFRVFDNRRPVTAAMAGFTALPTALFVVLSWAGVGIERIDIATTVAYVAHGCAIAVYAFRTSNDSTLRKVAGSTLLLNVTAIASPLLAATPSAEHWTLIFLVVTDLTSSVILTTVIFALDSERAYAALARMAKRDPLTGALNRLGFEHEINGLRCSAGIIVADLDHFKSVNDRFGHSGGDHVLRKFVRRATAVLPENTILARFGGEEFVAVVPGIDHDATLFLAERLRREIESSPIEGNGQTISVTVSVGVSTVSHIGDALAGIGQADMALYAAKNAGRNLVRAA